MILTEKDIKEYLIEKGDKITIINNKKCPTTYIFYVSTKSDLMYGDINIDINGLFTFHKDCVWIKYIVEKDTLYYNPTYCFSDDWHRLRVKTSNITDNKCFVKTENLDNFVNKYINEHPEEICVFAENQIKAYKRTNKRGLTAIKNIKDEIKQRENNIKILTALQLYIKQPDYLKNINIGDKFETVDGTICELIKIDQYKCLTFSYMVGKRKFSLDTYPNGCVSENSNYTDEFDIIKRI